MTPVSDRSFERRARRVRRALRRHPILQRLVNLAGVPLWRRHLARIAENAGIRESLPEVIELDPRTLDRALPRRLVTTLDHGDPLQLPRGLIRGGAWDRKAIPVARPAIGTTAPPPTDPSELDRKRIAVAFDRRGRACFVGEPDELAAYQESGASRVSAHVAVRHTRWAQVAVEARAYSHQRGGTAYQPYLHPDLADIPSDQGHERFDLLTAALPIRAGTLVDLGANSGYFSHRFEDLGFDPVAVERSEKEAYFLTAQRNACGRRFKILKGSLTEVTLPERPDVVLALNIFHHFLKTETAFEELQGFLRRLQARFLFLGAHLPDDPQMAGAARNVPPTELVEWIRRVGGFASVEEVGHAADRRPIFLLSAEG